MPSETSFNKAEIAAYEKAKAAHAEALRLRDVYETALRDEKTLQGKKEYKAAQKKEELGRYNQAQARLQEQFRANKEMTLAAEAANAHHQEVLAAAKKHVDAGKQLSDLKQEKWEVVLGFEEIRNETARKNRLTTTTAEILKQREELNKQVAVEAEKEGNTYGATKLTNKKFVLSNPDFHGEAGNNYIGTLDRLTRPAKDTKVQSVTLIRHEAQTLNAVLGQMHAKVQKLHEAVKKQLAAANVNREVLLIQSKQLAFYLKQAMIDIQKLDATNDLYYMHDAMKRYQDILVDVRNKLGLKVEAQADVAVNQQAKIAPRK